MVSDTSVGRLLIKAAKLKREEQVELLFKLWGFVTGYPSETIQRVVQVGVVPQKKHEPKKLEAKSMEKELVEIGTGSIGDIFVTPYQKRIKILKKNGSKVTVSIVNTTLECDVDTSYMVFPEEKPIDPIEALAKQAKPVVEEKPKKSKMRVDVETEEDAPPPPRKTKPRDEDDTEEALPAFKVSRAKPVVKEEVEDEDDEDFDDIFEEDEDEELEDEDEKDSEDDEDDEKDEEDDDEEDDAEDEEEDDDEDDDDTDDASDEDEPEEELAPPKIRTKPVEQEEEPVAETTPEEKPQRKPRQKKEAKTEDSGNGNGNGSKKQVALVVTLLKSGNQTRDSLAKAIVEAGLTKHSDEKNVKNYVSVMLTKLKKKYNLVCPQRGVYKIEV